MGKRSDFDRVPRDYYPTPIEAVEPLLAHLPYAFDYVEPCAGDGRLIRHITNLTQGTGAEEATASELTVGYSLNDNAALSLKYATSDLYNLDGDDFMWLSLSVTP